MTENHSKKTYGAVAKLFHWSTALIILGLLGLGLVMTRMEFSPLQLELYGIHKSFGTLVFVIVLLRVLWRFGHKKSAPLPTHKPWERKLSEATHISLYVFLFLMPLSGWLMTSAGAFPHHFFHLFNIPGLTGESEVLFKRMRTVHEFSAYALLGIIALHFAGAMKHHIIDRDITLKRMMPARPVIVFGLLIAIYAGLIGVNYAMVPREDITQSHADHDHSGNVQEQSASTSGEAHATPAPSWTMIKDESEITFTVNVSGKPFTGRFQNFDGDIKFDSDNLAGSSAAITINIGSVKSASVERDEYMVAKPWFNAESFPESRFVTRKFEKIEENQYTAHADLTIKGQTTPVEMPFTLEMTKDESGNNIANMTGRLTIRRLDYNVGEGEWSNTGNVANDVQVTVSVKVRQE